MKKFYHSFLIAFSMYSKIPMPQCEWNEENMAYAMCFFPWIGVAIGGVTWLWGTFGTYLGLSSAFYSGPFGLYLFGCLCFREQYIWKRGMDHGRLLQEWTRIATR